MSFKSTSHEHGQRRGDTDWSCACECVPVPLYKDIKPSVILKETSPLRGVNGLGRGSGGRLIELVGSIQREV